MNPQLSMPSLLFLSLAVVVGGALAEDAVRTDDAKLRAAIIRSVDFLAKEGDMWMNERDCNACHHLPQLIRSHREAKRRGLAIDEGRLAEFVEWADERATKANAGFEMMAFLKLAMPERPMPELTKELVEQQQADGSWKPGGQFLTMQRRDAPEATANSARIVLLGLATQDADKAATETARARAESLLANEELPKSIETLVFRLLYARRFASPENAEKRRAELLQHQHSDGGWSWMIAETESDALATGEVLYALQQSPDSTCGEAVARAQQWLLSGQREDGSWPIDITRISRLDRSAPAKSKSLKEATDIYTFWGSAWATIGLLEGLPVVAGARR